MSSASARADVLPPSASARVEGGDLVVVVVGGDEGLRGEQLVDHLHLFHVDALFREPFAVRTEILAHRGHRDRVAAQQLEVVGDVAGAAAEFAAHARHQERHVQDVHLVRQDVVLELVREHHDGVVGKGTTDQCGHRQTRLEAGAAAPGRRKIGTCAPFPARRCEGYRLGPVPTSLARAMAAARSLGACARTGDVDSGFRRGFTRFFLARTMPDC